MTARLASDEAADFEGLLVRPLRARHLCSADASGKADPYIVVRFQEQERGRTETKSQTLNPDWTVGRRPGQYGANEIRIELRAILACMEENHRSVDMEYVYLAVGDHDSFVANVMLGVARFRIASVPLEGSRPFQHLPIVLPRAQAKGHMDLTVAWSGPRTKRLMAKLRRTPLLGPCQLFRGFGMADAAYGFATPASKAGLPCVAPVLVFGSPPMEPVLDAISGACPIPGSDAVRPLTRGWLVLTPLRFLFFPQPPDLHAWPGSKAMLEDVERHRLADIQEIPLGNVKRVDHKGLANGACRLDVKLYDERKVSFMIGLDFVTSPSRTRDQDGVPGALRCFFDDGPQAAGPEAFAARVQAVAPDDDIGLEDGTTSTGDATSLACAAAQVLAAAESSTADASGPRSLSPIFGANAASPCVALSGGGLSPGSSSSARSAPPAGSGGSASLRDDLTNQLEDATIEDGPSPGRQHPAARSSAHDTPHFRCAWASGLRGAQVVPDKWCERVVKEIEWRVAAGRQGVLFAALLRMPVPCDAATGQRIWKDDLLGRSGRPTSRDSFGSNGLGLPSLVANGDSRISSSASTSSERIGRDDVSPRAASAGALRRIHGGQHLSEVMRREYRRMGLGSLAHGANAQRGPRNEEGAPVQCNWRVSAANTAYEVCASYPARLAVPTAVTDAYLFRAREERSRQRLPVLTWLHPETGAPLLRSSQPHTGIANATREDSAFLRAVRDCCAVAAASDDDTEERRLHSDSLLSAESVEFDDEHLELYLIGAAVSDATRDGSDAHIAYNIDVVVLAEEADVGDAYDEFLTIQRRYSDFATLVERLVASDMPERHKHDMPPVPPKTLFPLRLGSAGLRERLAGLQRLLAFLVALRTEGAAMLGHDARYIIDEFFDLYHERLHARLARDDGAAGDGLLAPPPAVYPSSVPAVEGRSTSHDGPPPRRPYRRRRSRRSLTMSEQRRSLSAKVSALVRCMGAADTASNDGVGARKKLRILDARPMLNAMANAFIKGKGFERVQDIGGNVELAFGDVANIHVMRQSHVNLGKAVASSSGIGGLLGTTHQLGVSHTTHRSQGKTSGTSAPRSGPRAWSQALGRGLRLRFGDDDEDDGNGVDDALEGLDADFPRTPPPKSSGKAPGGNRDRGNRGKALAAAAADWLHHVALLLQAANWGADMLDEGHALLVHCSDGWDRTAQIVSLAQLLLDPFYRTLEGFNELVRASWCAFGHMFQTRLHGGPRGEIHDQRGPIFLQFLDAVTQLFQQFPETLEFSLGYIDLLASLAYAGAFEEFCWDSEAERRRAAAAEAHDDAESAGAWPLHAVEDNVARCLLAELCLDAVPRDALADGSGDVVVGLPGCAVEGHRVHGLALAETLARRVPELLLLNPLYRPTADAQVERLVAGCDPTSLRLWRSHHLRFSAASAAERYMTPAYETRLLQTVVIQATEAREAGRELEELRRFKEQVTESFKISRGHERKGG